MRNDGSGVSALYLEADWHAGGRIARVGHKGAVRRPLQMPQLGHYATAVADASASQSE